MVLFLGHDRIAPGRAPLSSVFTGPRHGRQAGLVQRPLPALGPLEQRQLVLDEVLRRGGCGEVGGREVLSRPLGRGVGVQPRHHGRSEPFRIVGVPDRRRVGLGARPQTVVVPAGHQGRGADLIADDLAAGRLGERARPLDELLRELDGGQTGVAELLDEHAAVEVAPPIEAHRHTEVLAGVGIVDAVGDRRLDAGERCHRPFHLVHGHLDAVADHDLLDAPLDLEAPVFHGAEVARQVPAVDDGLERVLLVEEPDQHVGAPDADLLRVATASDADLGPRHRPPISGEPLLATGMAWGDRAERHLGRTVGPQDRHPAILDPSEEVGVEHRAAQRHGLQG